MKNPEVVQCVEENIVQKLDEVIQLRRAEAGHRESQARIERETLDIFADDLETADIGGKERSEHEERVPDAAQQLPNWLRTC